MFLMKVTGMLRRKQGSGEPPESRIGPGDCWAISAEVTSNGSATARFVKRQTKGMSYIVGAAKKRGQ